MDPLPEPYVSQGVCSLLEKDAMISKPQEAVRGLF